VDHDVETVTMLEGDSVSMVRVCGFVTEVLCDGVTDCEGLPWWVTVGSVCVREWDGESVRREKLPVRSCECDNVVEIDGASVGEWVSTEAEWALVREDEALKLRCIVAVLVMVSESFVGDGRCNDSEGAGDALGETLWAVRLTVPEGERDGREWEGDGLDTVMLYAREVDCDRERDAGASVRDKDMVRLLDSVGESLTLCVRDGEFLIVRVWLAAGDAVLFESVHAVVRVRDRVSVNDAPLVVESVLVVVALLEGSDADASTVSEGDAVDMTVRDLPERVGVTDVDPVRRAFVALSSTGLDVNVTVALSVDVRGIPVGLLVIVSVLVAVVEPASDCDACEGL
jgi:hypothetical protein